MPVSFSIDPRAKLVSYTVEGDASVPEEGEFLDAVLADPSFRRGFSFLGNRLGMRVAPTAAYIQAVAALLRSRAGLLAPCRWAVVVPSEDEFGAVRMWALLTGDIGVEVAPFTSETRARAWLAGTRA